MLEPFERARHFGAQGLGQGATVCAARGQSLGRAQSISAQALTERRLSLHKTQCDRVPNVKETGKTVDKVAPSHEAAEHANLPPVHAEQRAGLHPCSLHPCSLQPALLSHREELATHEIATDRRGGAPG